VLLAADGGHPNTQLVEVGKDATIVTELPLAVIEGDVLVPFMVTDFTSETLTLPCFASRTMVHVKAVVFLQELLTGSAYTLVLAGRAVGEDKKVNANTNARTTTTAPTTTSVRLLNSGRLTRKISASD